MNDNHNRSTNAALRHPRSRIWSLFDRSPSSIRGDYELVDNMQDHEAPPASQKPGDSIDGRHPAIINQRGLNGYDHPTESEKRSLRKVADRLPWSAFLVAVVEICERFTYNGLSGVFQNYIQNAPDDPSGLPGAIGLGQSGATGLTSFFQFFTYLTPILGAIVADQYLGRYWTIFYFAIIYCIGNFILFLTALPFAIANGAALGGLVIAMIVIAVGTGGIKANVAPLIAEQYANTTPFTRTLRSGERVIVDPAITVQSIYMIFYACINLGSLSPLATVYLEHYVGFWAAYLLCGCMFVLGITIIVLGKNTYIVHPPTGSIIPHAFRICFIAVQNRGRLDIAKPAVRHQHGLSSVPWNDQLVDEVGRALIACKVFLFYPVYWLAYGQMLNNFVSQAGSMTLHGIPNDLMQNIDPITILIFIPVMDRLVYPLLRRHGILFKPITRITFGFMFGAAAMAYAAFVQKLVYTSGPCYDAPRACEAAKQSDGTTVPNNVHVAVQTPAYLLIGLSEIFASITGLEYAYTKAPASMKSFIMSLYLLTTAVGAAFGALIAPSAVDPFLLRMYVGLALACFVAGALFWVIYKKYNAMEDRLNEL